MSVIGLWKYSEGIQKPIFKRRPETVTKVTLDSFAWGTILKSPMHRGMQRKDAGGGESSPDQRQMYLALQEQCLARQCVLLHS